MPAYQQDQQELGSRLLPVFLILLLLGILKVVCITCRPVPSQRGETEPTRKGFSLEVGKMDEHDFDLRSEFLVQLHQLWKVGRGRKEACTMPSSVTFEILQLRSLTP